MGSHFDPELQKNDLPSKIVVGLERVSEAFKAILWEKAKSFGLSPIQIQIVVFVAYHQPRLCTVTQLACEFNITKPTVSDAVRVLIEKNLVAKKPSSSDSRSYTIHLTRKGNTLLHNVEDFALPLHRGVGTLDESDLTQLYSSLTKLIYSLNRNGILNVQRTCFGCSYYRSTKDRHHCSLLSIDLVDSDIRLDCPEFVEKVD